MRAYMTGHSYSLTRILSYENYYCSITARASRPAVTKPSCCRHVLCELARPSLPARAETDAPSRQK